MSIFESLMQKDGGTKRQRDKERRTPNNAFDADTCTIHLIIQGPYSEALGKSDSFRTSSSSDA